MCSAYIVYLIMIKTRIGRQSLRKFDKNTRMKFLAVLTPIIIIITLTYVYKCLRMYTIPYVSDGAGHVCIIGDVYNGNIKIIYLLSWYVLFIRIIFRAQ